MANHSKLWIANESVRWQELLWIRAEIVPETLATAHLEVGALPLSYRCERQRGLSIQPLQVQSFGARSLGERSESLDFSRYFYLRHQAFDVGCKTRKEFYVARFVDAEGVGAQACDFHTLESSIRSKQQTCHARKREECPLKGDLSVSASARQMFLLYW